MKRLLISLSIVLLIGCASVPPENQFVQSCQIYDGVLKSALVAAQDGYLSPVQVANLKLINSQVTPICLGPIPTDPQVAVAQITAAVTTLTVYAKLGITK